MKILKTIGLLLLLTFGGASIAQTPLVVWEWDENGLPSLDYQGAYPFKVELSKQATSMTTDPYFALGNYRMLLFAHVSGTYQLLTAERSWGRLNQGDSINTGVSGAYLKLGKKRVALTGPNSLAENRSQTAVKTGVGYMSYRYQMNKNLSVKRTIKVAPSQSYDGGLPAFLVEVEIENSGKRKEKVDYHEFVRASYEMNYQQRSAKKVDYRADVKQVSANLIKADMIAETEVPFLWKDRETAAEYEGYPPSLFISSLEVNGTVTSYPDASGKPLLDASVEVTLKPAEKKTVYFVVGIEATGDVAQIKQMIEKLQQDDVANSFASAWKNVLPLFEAEKDDRLRMELIWDAHTLEAMSMYSGYFQETKTPQGSAYDYYWGLHGGIRDHLQHMLPMCYYNPEVAKSALRYCLKKVTPRGEAPISEKGIGYQTDEAYKQSDNQLFLLNSLNEYLRITGDYAFLMEDIAYYPLEAKTSGTVLDHIEMMHLFLRDEISVGPRGLVRLLNSDWNDDIHFVLAEKPYNRMYFDSESMLNSTMLVKVYGDMLRELEKAKKVEKDIPMIEVDRLLESITYQRKTMLENVMKDWGGATYLRRFYWIDESVGHDKIYLWPQAFALQIPEVSIEKKQALLQEVEEKLIKPEKVGARLMEGNFPLKRGEHYAEIGCGENGGCWYSPFGQLVIGTAEVDIDKAWQFFERTTFRHISSQYPDLWIGQWTSSDYVNSSLTSAYPGHSQNMVYNAHPHAYQLYMYYLLKEKESTKQ
ncbi:hypothetical protein V6R21_00535 [Limibacter armeniacum]|uniref:GH36-type glycosyl hydrolase domain-containing protein n=1 Tax=Limibacter armeniacum TaxID=466084 RepID=UPI002FE6668D